MTHTIVANGLACLDVMGVDGDAPPRLSAGGCPNALILLRNMGWNAIPVAGLGTDRAGDYVLDELRNWQLDCRFVTRRDDMHTPVYVLYHRNGGHFYGKKCPYCNTRFPLYTPLHSDTASRTLNELPNEVHVFYFDKISPVAMIMAKYFKQRSSLIMFEPNRIDDEDLFRQSVEITDIMKYSSERRTGVRAFTDSVPVPLEIETAGSKGVNYRLTDAGKRSGWFTVPSVPVTDFVDAAGAGDWLTASLIHSLHSQYPFDSVIRDRQKLETILIEGQQASVGNCRFPGARGALYVDRPMLQGYDFCPYCRGKGKGKE